MVKKIRCDCDVAIVGAGPAGSTAAYILGKNGFRVLLLDKENFPRAKLCGGALTTKTIRLVDEIFGETADSLTQKKIIDYKADRYEIRFKNECLINRKSAHTFYFVDRYLYDDLLLNKAKQASVDVLEGEKVTGINIETGELKTAAGKRITAKFIIAADGVNSVVRTALFKQDKLDGRRWLRNLAYALEVFIDRAPESPGFAYPVLSYGYLNYGYAWIFPNQTRLVAGLGGLKRKNKNTNPADTFRVFLRDFNLFNGATFKLRGHPLPFGNYLSRPAWGKFLIAGDAAGLVDPVLGEGIYQAHKSGQLAAWSIIAGREEMHSVIDKSKNDNLVVQTYITLMNIHLIPDFYYARKYRHLVFNRLNRSTKFSVVKLLGKRFENLAELVHGSRSYRRPWIKKRDGEME